MAKGSVLYLAVCFVFQRSSLLGSSLCCAKDCCPDTDLWNCLGQIRIFDNSSVPPLQHPVPRVYFPKWPCPFTILPYGQEILLLVKWGEGGGLVKGIGLRLIQTKATLALTAASLLSFHFKFSPMKSLGVFPWELLLTQKAPLTF